MLHWLIPYLVVYNSSDHGHWEYGPEHLFKAEINSEIMFVDDPKMRTNVNIFFSCRPINLSFIQCRIESASRDTCEYITGAQWEPLKFEDHTEMVDMVNSTFQIEFNKNGANSLTFLNTKGHYRQNMIRVIAGEFDIGTDLSDKELEMENIFVEKSLNGICETKFYAKVEQFSYPEDELAPLEGFNFDVPSFLEREENETIIIEKTREMKNCSVKRNYFFFGQTEKAIGHFKRGLTVDNDITRSITNIYLGKNGYRSYTENEGTTKVNGVGMASKLDLADKGLRAKMSETVSIRLVTIRPATEELEIL